MLSLLLRRKQETNLAKIGQIPGSLIESEEGNTGPSSLSLITFNPNNYQESEIDLTGDIPLPENKNQFVYWYNFTGVNNARTVAKMRDTFHLHPLIAEDIMNCIHRPKSEVHNDYMFLILKMISLQADSGKIAIEQVSFIIGDNYVISFQEREGDIFDPIRSRIKEKRGRIHNYGAQYLAYALVDIVVDNYFIVSEWMSERVMLMENRVLKGKTDNVIPVILMYKKDLIYLRRSIEPLSDAVSKIEKECHEKYRGYYHDLTDHIIHQKDALNNYREMIGSVTDLYHSSLSTKMNEVMKLLTVISTTFIPLSFLVGVYGMNFEYMPELDERYGYFVLWGIIIVIVALMLLFFKRKKWF